MRTHGWGGRPPADDEEARDRIVRAAKARLARFGPERSGLAAIAADLSVTRQTVYRYFASTEDLLRAAALESSGEFLHRLERQVADLQAPSAILAEAVAWTIERLPHERYIGVLVKVGTPAEIVDQLTSPVALGLARTILERFRIDWVALGYDDRDLDELAEVMLRLFGSFALRPPGDTSPTDIREFLQRFFGRMLRPALDRGV